MKLILLICFFLGFGILSARTQSSLPPVYEINTDTVTSQQLDSTFWQRLEDKKGKWTFEEVSQPPLSGKFHVKGIKPEGIDTNGIHTYWNRYRLKNIMSRDAKISLMSSVDFFDVYLIKPDSSVVHYTSGFLQKWDKKDGLRSAGWAGALPLVLSPGEEVLIYDRRDRRRDTNFTMAVRFLSTDKLVQEAYIDYVDARDSYFNKIHLQEAFVIGLIFLSIFVSLFFYRVVKEKVYLYFALYAFFLGVNRHYNIAYEYTSLHLPEWNRYVNYIGFAWNFIPFFLIQFIRYFYNIRGRFPKWDKFLFWTGLLNLVSGCIVLVRYIIAPGKLLGLYELTTILSFYVIPVSIIITLLLFIRNSNKSFRYIAIGSLPLMLLYVIANIPQYPGFFGQKFASYFSILQQHFRLIEVTFISWMILWFTWVLFMRFDKLRKENAQQALDKERLAKEKEIEKNELIAKQNTELENKVAERTAELQQSLDTLRSTQQQLIQSEKMASLGELTAGIAHEIQNPLNFVNNFSEINTELIEELRSERTKGRSEKGEVRSERAEVKSEKSKGESEKDEQLEDELLNDIAENEKKINHHGKRADAIVKGMLQHSRSSSGAREPTNINALADEYLHLAYHGLRAKDKAFNATLKTDYDESIGNIHIIPQDIGRCILNLITNAFYAVSEKSRQAPAGYEPTVMVSTKKINDRVEIRVKDNGMGIPQKIVEKIFQPFFTTKPTGEGTGLGLSLSYDIIKAHGGEIKVESREGEGTEFTVIL